MGCLVFKTGKDIIETESTASFFSYEAINIDGQKVRMSQYEGKKAILVVNVACKCGLTSAQYKGLVDLYKKYQSQGLEILGFPCNQFLKQEPWDEPKIQKFVVDKYGASFPLFQKVEVNGNNPHPIYKFLRTNSELFDPATKRSKMIPWNFGKFLINAKGQVIAFYKPATKVKDIEPVLEKILEESISLNI